MTNNLVASVCTTISQPSFKDKLAQALPPGIDVDRFTRTALTAIQMKPEIVEADRQSLYNAVISAAQQGLMPDNREGAIVVYNTKVNGQWVKAAQFQPMVAGVIKRFGDAGILAYAASVHRNDKFELWNDDTGQHVRHEPQVFGDRGEFCGTFAVARTPDGRTYVETMTLDDIERIKAASRSKDREGNAVGPWKDWSDRMAQKSALHRLGRRVPISTGTDASDRLASVIQADAGLYDFDRATGEIHESRTTPVSDSGERRPSGLQSVVDSEQSEPDVPHENGAEDPDF